MTGIVQKGAIFLSMLFLFGCAGSSKSSYLHKSPYIPMETLSVGSILHVPTGTLVSRDDLMGYMEGSRVVYVGESHTNSAHHKVQLDIIKTLSERGQIAVGMEMFSRSSQAELDRWLKGELDDKAFFRLWMDNWGLDYEYYREILEFVRRNNIPLIGLNMSRGEVSDMIDGHNAKKKAVPQPELDEYDPYHRAMIKAVFRDPSHGSASDFDSFYRVQLLWEETMAETVAMYLENPENKDKGMVVLSGGGHVAYGFGIPKRVFRRLKEPYTIVLPVSPDAGDKKTAKRLGVKMLKSDMPDVPLYAADFAWAVAYESLEGMAARLGVALVDEAGAVRVSNIEPRSNAQRAGVREGDLIKGFDGLPVKDRYDLLYYLSKKRAHDTIILTLVREGNKKDVTVVFEPYEESN
ncbi:MAG: ChaN family lipoprotein [Deltaproteobacteria bacterium]|nr:ChaN family lipoprotein [Deltaproteobacteria bacterium]